MKLLLLGVALVLVATPTMAKSVYVKGYVTKNGTYVPPHYRSSPDNTTLNNYSTRPNINPYTGKTGTTNPYALPKLKPLPPLSSYYETDTSTDEADEPY